MTRPFASRNRYTPGWSGSARRCSARLVLASRPLVGVSIAIPPEDTRRPAARPAARPPLSVGAPVAVGVEQAVDHDADEREPSKLAEARLPHAFLADHDECRERDG